MAQQPSSQSASRCWWFGCHKDATTIVTANDVQRVYCVEHAGRVERYYARAARWEAKTEHSHA